MQRIFGFFLLLLCPFISSANQDNLQIAESFLDAFYTFDQSKLARFLAPNADADRVLYYQAWAQAANYKVKQRTPCALNVSKAIVCAVTVTDDFGQTMGYVATDTFTMTFHENKVSAISFEGDDPPIFQQLFAWIAENRPEILEGPCKDLFAGGKTPGDCARAVVVAAKEFVAL
ncbi:MAG: hypothetical protein HON25_07790 [Gammaproteobacteria bacterium]|nr:hypothetical protein [Gammaproteobacteria bacterium]